MRQVDEVTIMHLLYLNKSIKKVRYTFFRSAMTVALAGVIMLFPRIGHLSKLSSYNHLKEIKKKVTKPQKTKLSLRQNIIKSEARVKALYKYPWKIYN